MLSQEKFELLGEVAINAIVDGYFREAVASFTASMERLFEHFIRVIWELKGISSDQIDSAWKKVKKQSERQLGMFIALYLSETHELPKLLSDQSTNFRNEVVHQGKIPTEQEAILFGQAVADVMAPLIWKLRQDPFKDSVFRLYQRHFLAKDSIVMEETSQSAVQMLMPTFDLHNTNESVDIAARIEMYKGRLNFPI
jgi:hypothetical protein